MELSHLDDMNIVAPTVVPVADRLIDEIKSFSIICAGTPSH